ncbi:MAG: COG1361 S-layer family protein [Candidatus Aenigmarchaeota archaeon]|nr:COG1361 S-layer family protein [Candidatus Aenigmarchaeota archaeon]
MKIALKNKSIKYGFLFSFLTIIFVSSICFGATIYMPNTHHIDVGLLNQQPDPVEPGKYIELRFNVINTGLEDAKNVLFEIDPEFPFSLDSETDALKNLGTILGGATGNNGITVYYKLFVNKLAKQGNADIKIKYKIDNNLWVTKTFTLRIRSNQSLLTVEQIRTSPQTINPGSICTVSLTLKNNGDDDIKNVILNIVPVTIVAQATGTTYIESEFTPYEDSTEKIIKSIEKGKSETITFKLIASSSAELKPYKMPVQITYEDRMGVSYSKNIYVGLIVEEEVDYVSLAETEEQLIENSKNKVYITISNKGKSKMNFVYVEILPSDEYNILSTSGIYLGNLDSDDEDNAEYELFFHQYNYTKNVPLNVKISYRDSYNNKYTDSKKLDVVVHTKEDIAKYDEIKSSSSTTNYAIVLTFVLLVFWLWRRRKKKEEEDA